MEMTTLKVPCPNCEKVLRPTYQVCQLGHVVCPQCRLHQDGTYGQIVDSKRCFQITFPLPILNKLFLSVKDTCQYGCGIETDILILGDHENICKLRNKIVECAFPGCEWMNVLTKLINHVYKEHPGQLLDLFNTDTKIVLNFENPIVLGTRYPITDKDNEIYWIKLFERNAKKYVIVLLQGKTKPQNEENFDLVRYSISNANYPKLRKDFVVSSSTTETETVLNEDFIMDQGLPLTSLEADNYHFEFKFDELIPWQNPFPHYDTFSCIICNASMEKPSKVCSRDHIVCEKCSSFFTSCQKCKYSHKMTLNPLIPWVKPEIPIVSFNCTLCIEPIKLSGMICHRKHLICIPCINEFKIAVCRLCKPRCPVSVNPAMRRNPTVSTGNNEDQPIENSFEMVTRSTASMVQRRKYRSCKYKEKGCHVIKTINKISSHEEICTFKLRASIDQEEDSFVVITAESFTKEPEYSRCKYKEVGCRVFETIDKLISHVKICTFKTTRCGTDSTKKMGIYKKIMKSNFCKYKIEGCKFFDTIDKLPPHEDICTFKLTQCAKESCDFIGRYNDITMHWKQCHKEWRQDNGSSFSDSCFTYLIPCGGKNFILTWANNDNTTHYLSVHHLTPEKTTDFYFKVDLFNPRTMATDEFSGPCIASRGEQVRDHDYRLSAGRDYKFTRSISTTMKSPPSNRHMLTIKITKGCEKY